METFEWESNFGSQTMYIVSKQELDELRLRYVLAGALCVNLVIAIVLGTILILL